MTAFIPGHVVPVVTGALVPFPTTALQAVLLASLLVLVFEKVVLTTVQDDVWRRVSSGLNIGLIPLGVAAAFIVGQAIG
jgi:hypothetical protein